METDVFYFARRAREERAAAEAATQPVARKAHLELANRYADLASAISERERLLGLDTARFG